MITINGLRVWRNPNGSVGLAIRQARENVAETTVTAEEWVQLVRAMRRGKGKTK